MPLVSVIIPAYNHEAYVEECIESVLNQTFQDFEIVITDDASKDGTVAVIEQFKDSRIKLFRHEVNLGACIAGNNCLKHAQGQYIAMLSSDDVWMPEKLEKQVDYLNAHPEVAAVFGKVVWVDENTDPIIGVSFPFHNVFEVENRSRFEWLNHFFFVGNCLCHPCSLIRREIYDEVGWFNPTMANLPDFDLWVRLCLNSEIFIQDEHLIKFRRMPDETNASGDNLRNRIRTRFETYRIMDNYLKLVNVDEFKAIFPESISFGDFEAIDIPYLLARLALRTNLEVKQFWGLNLLYSLLQNEDSAKRISDRFAFSHIDFIKEVPNFDVFKLRQEGLGTPSATASDELVQDAVASIGSQYISVPSDNMARPSTLDAGDKSRPIDRVMGSVIRKLRTLKRELFLKQDMALINQSDWFDSYWYLEQNPDVRQSGLDPLKHYLLYGGFEGRNPSEKFSSSGYLDLYWDVASTGINPLVHYLKYGSAEGRKPKV